MGIFLYFRNSLWFLWNPVQPPLELEIGGIHLHLKQRHLNAFNGTPQIFHSLAEESFLTKMCRSEKLPKPSYDGGLSWKNSCIMWVPLFPSVLRMGWQIKEKRDHCHVSEIVNQILFLNLCLSPKKIIFSHKARLQLGGFRALRY